MIINDGLERTIHLSDLVKDLLDTPEVQRTEKINTTGFLFKGFPGIHHPRKTHLIGVVNNAGIVYRALKKNSPHIPDTTLKTLETLAMTHDLGHPPFSHPLGQVVESQTGKTHEQLSAEIVAGNITFFDYFSQRPHLYGHAENVALPLEKYQQLETVPQILRRHHVDADLVVRILAGESIRERDVFVRELIDNPLFDIDKMDYIPRDGWSANVNEAKVEASRIVNSLRVVNWEGAQRIAIADRELEDLEAWINARKVMYSKVYMHESVLVFECMLIEALKRSFDYFQEHDIEFHLLTDNLLLNFLLESNPVSAELAFDVSFGRQYKYTTAYRLTPNEVVSGNPQHTLLLQLIEYAKSKPIPFPEDAIRREIYEVATTGNNAGIQEHDILVHTRRYRTEEDWRKKFDMLVYSYDDPSKVTTLQHLVDDTGPFTNSYAAYLFQSFCKPETSTYFSVYCKREHLATVKRATRKFLEKF